MVDGSCPVIGHDVCVVIGQEPQTLQISLFLARKAIRYFIGHLGGMIGCSSYKIRYLYSPQRPITGRQQDSN